ncbi:MAG TPA: cysteine desulfurase family protein [Acidimicrobiales bacterium]|nr:cysteine desulfurase family protein [Acidimicrobiales bacterium]
MSGTRHYLDHASTSPLRPEAAAAIESWCGSGVYADPGRQYGEGRIARDAIEDARAAVAGLLGVRPREVILTSGGTEAANTASSLARPAGASVGALCSPAEHSAVRLAARRAGRVVDLEVDGFARLDLDHLAAVLEASSDAGPPALVHCQWANHEVGTVQPVAEVVELAHRYGIPVHVDACVALGHVPIDLGEVPADLVSLSAHKIGGPPGVGALVVRRPARVTPLLVGGDQERGRRAGMENVPGVLAFGAIARTLAAPCAVEIAAARERELADALLQAALAVGGVAAYGDTEVRAPHIVCVGVEGVEAEAVVLGLDQAGIAVHSGSACSSEAFEPSPVLEAMGVDARRSLRISVGWSSTEADVAAFARRFPEVVERLRELAASSA